MPSKLYVGNLAYSVTNADLEALFAQAGKVESAVVVTDKFSGQSKGFGFVEMADSNEAAQAISTLNDAELKGRRIKVDEARPRENSFGRGGGGGGGGERRGGGGGRPGGGGGRGGKSW
jgi:RNA recognition motif-containing protein